MIIEWLCLWRSKQITSKIVTAHFCQKTCLQKFIPFSPIFPKVKYFILRYNFKRFPTWQYQKYSHITNLNHHFRPRNIFSTKFWTFEFTRVVLLEMDVFIKCFCFYLKLRRFSISYFLFQWNPDTRDRATPK